MPLGAKPWIALPLSTPDEENVVAKRKRQAGQAESQAQGGCLMEVSSGAVLSRGLSMPHSPRWHNGLLWLLESGTGQLVLVDPANGRRQKVAELPADIEATGYSDHSQSVETIRILENSGFERGWL